MAYNFQWIGKSTDGTSVILKKFTGAFQTASYATEEWIAGHADRVRLGAVIDVETTGLNKKSDEIIEIGLRRFLFNKVTGELLKSVDSYSAFQDPGRPLTDDIKRITGLTDEMLAGKHIDWARVDALLSESGLIIAHNASFDRPFIDRHSKVSPGKTWACSVKQIDWSSKHYPSQKLEILSIFHGFFTDAHRALHDVDALLHLISHQDGLTGKPYLDELLRNARRPVVKVVAANSPFDSKDFLKERGYGWDTAARAWHKTIFKENLETEIAWLETKVYNGEFKGSAVEIPLVDNFKG